MFCQKITFLLIFNVLFSASVPIVSENTCYNCVHVHGSSSVRQELAGIVATMRLALCRRKRAYTLGKSLL